VYALACVLYECLTGRQPYPGASVEQQITGHLTLPAPAPSRLNSAVPGGFDEVIAKGMAKDPELRYQSAAELARAARDALSAPPASAARPATAGPPADPTVELAPLAAGRVGRAGARPAGQTQPLVDTAVSGPRPAAVEPAVGAPMWVPGAGAWPGALPPPPLPAARGEHNRWRVVGITVLVVAVVVAVLAGGGIYYAITHTNKPAPSTTTTAPSGPAVTVATMDALLLNAAEINTAIGTTTMTVIAAVTTLGDQSVSPPECLPLAGALQTKVYAGSGWMAAHGQAFREPSGQYPHVFDGVVVFPSAQKAAAFFTASSKSWPACSNRGYSFTDDAGQPAQRTVGPVSITNGTISATNVTEGGDGLACQHALTASSNVVVETLFCGYNTTDQAVRMAQQVAAKVPRS
jgi:serine/threonine kinase PknH